MRKKVSITSFHSIRWGVIIVLVNLKIGLILNASAFGMIAAGRNNNLF